MPEESSSNTLDVPSSHTTLIADGSVENIVLSKATDDEGATGATSDSNSPTSAPSAADTHELESDWKSEPGFA
eukprot:15454269-Alexandrium_andersonii.AAC.1